MKIIKVRTKSLEEVLELLKAGDPGNAALLVTAILIGAGKEEAHAN